MGILHKNSVTSALPAAVAATETAVYTTPVLGPVGPAEVAGPIDISGTIALLLGTAGTSIGIKCHQGNGIAGPLVPGGIPGISAVAGSTYDMSFGFTDTTGYLQGGGQYTISVTQASASGNGTTNAIDIKVQFLWHRLAWSAARKYSRR